MKGLKDRAPKQIDRRELSRAIQARMEEIMEFVFAEIYHSGYENQLVGGIVLTGGGAQLQHMKQLAEHVTGLDARIGLPGEHLAKGLVEEVNHAIYATSVGLVIHALDNAEEERLEVSSEVLETPQVEDKKSTNLLEGSPKVGLLEKVKSWFEGQLNGTGNYIE
jgi:cell division protein FtsA